MVNQVAAVGLWSDVEWATAKCSMRSVPHKGVWLSRNTRGVAIMAHKGVWLSWHTRGVAIMGTQGVWPSWHIECTSFSPLLHFALQDISVSESYALNIVSYAGCGISLLCLLMTIVIFVSCGWVAGIFIALYHCQWRWWSGVCCIYTLYLDAGLTVLTV